MPILSVLQKYLDELEWEVSSFDHEGGHSQYEFDFGYTDVVDMCDRFVFMRLMLKEVAKTFGAFVTFMPKPFPNDFRSGAHLNMSIVDEHGSNLMRDASDSRGIGFSKLAYNFVGGLLDHASSLAAVSCPTVNGYKGFVPAGIAFFSTPRTVPRTGGYTPDQQAIDLGGLIRLLPPDRPGLGIVLTDEIKNRYLFAPGSGEFNSVPGKILKD